MLLNALLADAAITNASLPFFKFPDFQDSAKQVLERTSALSIRWNPLLKGDEMGMWEEFSGLSFPMESLDPVVSAWQQAPHEINLAQPIDLLSDHVYHKIAFEAISLRHPVLSPPSIMPFGPDMSNSSEPLSLLIVPVFADRSETAEVVGFLDAALSWTEIFAHALPETIGELDVEYTDNCRTEYTFLVEGSNATFVGEGLEERSYEYRNVNFMRSLILEGTNETKLLEAGACIPTITSFGTPDLRGDYRT